MKSTCFTVKVPLCTTSLRLQKLTGIFKKHVVGIIDPGLPNLLGLRPRKASGAARPTRYIALLRPPGGAPHSKARSDLQPKRSTINIKKNDRDDRFCLSSETFEFR